MKSEDNMPVNSATKSISDFPSKASMDAAEEGSAATSEASSWDAWLKENGSRLLLFARQQTRSIEDAQDVLQDALVKLASKIEEGVFDGGQAAWKPYLYTTIRRLSIDLGRKNDRRSKREEKSEADRRGETGGVTDPWFENVGSNDETKNLLEENIKKLPSKFSEVIVMKIWGENTFAEIGEILGVSLNTVASRYRYGLERLRKGLESARQNHDI